MLEVPFCLGMLPAFSDPDSDLLHTILLKGDTLFYPV